VLPTGSTPHQDPRSGGAGLPQTEASWASRLVPSALALALALADHHAVADTAVPLGIVVAVLTAGGLVALSRSSAATVATTPEDEVVAPPA
jgi:hypothetical protein